MHVLSMEELRAEHEEFQDLHWRTAAQLPLLTRKAIWNMRIIPHAGELDKVFFNGILSHMLKDVRVWEMFPTYHKNEDSGYEIIFSLLVQHCAPS